MDDRRAYLSAASTCCLDILLMTAFYAYNKVNEFAQEAKDYTLNEDDSSSSDCIAAISIGKCSNDLEVARAKLLLKAGIFRTNKVSKPLTPVNAQRTKYTISLGTSEALLTGHFLLKFNIFSRRSVCSNSECGDRIVTLKFILIQEKTR